MSDGVATLGRRDTPGLREAVDALAKAGAQRLDLVAIGRAPASATLASLTHAGLLVDGKLDPEAIATRLQQQPAAPARVEVSGASWSWPTQLTAARPGDEVLVFAELDRGQPLRIQVGDLSVRKLETVTGTPALVRRAHAGAKIDALVRELGDPDDAGEQERIAEIVALSTEHRVLSPFTSMIVLETELDYQTFGIDRAALSDILIVTDDGIETTDRRERPPARVSGIASPSGALERTQPDPRVGSDEDGDGIADEIDRCPDQPETANGYQDDDGCPDAIPQEVRDFRSTIRGIEFAAGSARIEPDPHPVLDRAVEVLTKFPQVTIEISGHSDPKGSYARAMEWDACFTPAVKEKLKKAGVEKIGD